MYDLREWHILNGISRRTISLMNNEHIFFCVHSISKAWHCQCQDLTSSFSTLTIGFWEDLYLFVMCAIYKYHILAIGELDFIKERNVSWLLSWYIFSSWWFFSHRSQKMNGSPCESCLLGWSNSTRNRNIIDNLIWGQGQLHLIMFHSVSWYASHDCCLNIFTSRICSEVCFVESNISLWRGSHNMGSTVVQP